MTVTELRDRLNDRFRLLVGSRRGLERHQTLRHAVQWSYDLLDEDERALLNGCSVFAGGFDLAGACAAAGSDDEFATLDLLKALVRKSLLVADRSSGRTRFSMLETIRQFAEEQLVVGGKATTSVPLMPATSLDGKLMCSPSRTVRNNARPTSGSPPNCPTCAPLSGGLPTGTISTLPLPSPNTRDSWACWLSSTSPSGGRRNSSNPRKRLNVRGSQHFIAWPASAVGSASSIVDSIQREWSAAHRERALRGAAVRLRRNPRSSIPHDGSA